VFRVERFFGELKDRTRRFFNNTNSILVQKRAYYLQYQPVEIKTALRYPAIIV